MGGVSMNVIELVQNINNTVFETFQTVKDKQSSTNGEIASDYFEISQCVNKMNEIKNCLSGMTDLTLLNSSQGTTADAANACINELNNIKALFHQYVEILAKAVLSIKTQFQQSDAETAKIASAIGAISVITGSEVGNTSEEVGTVQVIGKGETWVNTRTDEELSAYDNALLNDGSTSVWGRYNKYYSGIRAGTVNCTWYTGKKCEANGFNLNYFHPGNGKDWYNGIQSTESYTATKYSGANCLNDLINSEGQPVTNIVISFPYSYQGGPYGHVLYIDQIVDGKVYYSDNGSPGVRKVKTIDSFLAGFKSAGNGSPIGCVHLEANE